jgi:TRAP-type C4-dicarboxylate transport system substrate-binding protein
MRYTWRNLILVGIVLATLLALLAGCSSAATTTKAPVASITSQAPVTTTAAPAVSTITPPVAAKTVELRLAHAWANTHLMHKVIQTWADDVNKETQGRVKITIYPGGALSTATQLYDTAATGVADMVWMLHGYTPGKFPVSSVIELPFMGNSAVNATKIFYDLKAKYPQIDQEHTNVKILYMWGIDQGQLMTTKASVKTIADVKGLKLRVGSASTSPMVEALGGVPVLMNISDLFDSLQKDVIQGTMLGTSAIKTFNLAPVIDNMVIANIFTNTQGVVVNNVSWSKIPKQDQDIIMNLSGQKQAEVAANAYEAEALLAMDMAKADKMNIYTLPAAELAKWKEAMNPIYQKWVADMNAKGLPGQAILDDAMKLNEKYK